MDVGREESPLLVLPCAGRRGRRCWHHILNALYQTPPRHPRGCDVFHLTTLKNINLWKVSLKQSQTPSQSSESVSWRWRTPRVGGDRDLLLFLPLRRGDGWRPRPSLLLLLLRLRRRAGLGPGSLPLPEDSVSCRRRLPAAFLPWCLRGHGGSDSGDANKVILVEKGFGKARRCQRGILMAAKSSPESFPRFPTQLPPVPIRGRIRG